jgi:thiamine biosynthesis protein ThiI
MSLIASVTSLPILRPLVGMDKEEIVEQAGRLGSFEISIIPDQDCCQLFTPKHPATRATRVAVEEAESRLPIDEMVARAVEQAEAEHFAFPARTTSQDP